MRTGVDRNTGKILTGWDHCRQSISVVLTTAVGTLLMARDFGSDVPLMIDRPSSEPQIAQITMACATALRREEPGFRLRRVQVTNLGADGIAEFDLAGDFYPNGHLGDFSVIEPVSGLIAITGTFDARSTGVRA